MNGFRPKLLIANWKHVKIMSSYVKILLAKFLLTINPT